MNPPTPPTSVQVMHLNFEIKFCSGDTAEQANAFGWCNKQIQTITIREGLRPRLLVDTLWHELTHACFFAAGIAEEGLVEEQICSQLVGPMLCIVKDNPELMAWTNYLLELKA